MEVVKKMELVGTSDGKPTSNVKIIDCGEVSQLKGEDAAEKDKGSEVNFWLWNGYVYDSSVISREIEKI